MWFVIIVIIIIIFIVKSNGNTKTENTKNKSAPSSDLIIRYFNDIDNFINKCYDKTTLRFDWELFLHEYDTYTYSGIPEVVKYLEDKLRSICNEQIRYINYKILYPAIYTGDYNKVSVDLSKINYVIVNLQNFWFKWDISDSSDVKEWHSCPQNILSYRDILYNIMYKKTACNMMIVQKALDLVKDI